MLLESLTKKPKQFSSITAGKSKQDKVSAFVNFCILGHRGFVKMEQEDPARFSEIRVARTGKEISAIS